MRPSQRTRERTETSMAWRLVFKRLGILMFADLMVLGAFAFLTGCRADLNAHRWFWAGIDLMAAFACADWAHSTMHTLRDRKN